MSTYWELLKDPRWQKKRLAIFERDKFTCQFCWHSDKELHAHHTYYEWGKDPWDYPDEAIKTLCVDCHKEATEIIRQIKRSFQHLDMDDLKHLLGHCHGKAIKNVFVEKDGDRVFSVEMDQPYCYFNGLAEACHVKDPVQFSDRFEWVHNKGDKPDQITVSASMLKGGAE